MKKLKYYALALGIFLPLNAYSSGPVYPRGWREPNREELSHVMRSERNEKDTLVSGDFTGNGLVDGAAILVREDKKEIALFSFVYYAGNDEEEWIKLDSQGYTEMITMGISAYPPGEYKVLCYGNDECDENGKIEIEIPTASIKYFQHEKSSSIFIWDKKKEAYIRIWETD